MRKKIVFEYIFIIFSCLLGGIFDCYSFIFRDKSFCLIQTGNTVKMIIEFTSKNFSAAVSSLILIVSYCFFVLIFYLIIKWQKSKNINYYYFVMMTIAIFLLPSLLLDYDHNNYLNYKNIISGIFLSGIGAMLSISYKSVQFFYQKKMIFNVAMMTGNFRSLMICIADYIRTKDKESLQLLIAYSVVITTFIFGVFLVAITFKFLSTFGVLIFILLLVYSIILIMIIFLHFRYKLIKSITK